MQSSDMAGTVVASQSPLWKEGDSVLSLFNQTHLTGQIKAEDMKSGLGLPLDGTLQEYRVFAGESLVKKPQNLSYEEACTLPIAGVTAWMALNGMRPRKSKSTCLVQQQYSFAFFLNQINLIQKETRITHHGLC